MTFVDDMLPYLFQNVGLAKEKNSMAGSGILDLGKYFMILLM